MVDPTELNGRVDDTLERRFARIGERTYLLPIRGRGGYCLLPGEREWLVACWEERTDRARWFLKLSVYANIPFILLEMLLISVVPPLREFVRYFDGLLMGLVLLAGLPLAGLLVHYRSTRAANAWLVEAVGDRPLVYDPALARRSAYDPFDIAAIGLLAVHLALEIYARLNPEAMPHYGPASPAALVVSAMIVAWFGLRWLHRRSAARRAVAPDWASPRRIPIAEAANCLSARRGPP